MSVETKYNQKVEQKIEQRNPFPVIDIVDINPLRAEIPGSIYHQVSEKLPWSPATSDRRPTFAPVRIMRNPSEVLDIAKSVCKSDKKTGELHLSELILAAEKIS